MYSTHPGRVPKSSPDDQKMTEQKRANLTLDLQDSTGRRPRLSLTDLALLSPSAPQPAPPAVSGTTAGKLATPTPTQFLFPRSVTEEQEAYAHGFARALEELYRQQGPPMAPGAVSTTSTTSSSKDDSTFCTGNGNGQQQQISQQIVSRSNNVTTIGGQYLPCSQDSHTSIVTGPVCSTQQLQGNLILKSSSANQVHSVQPAVNTFRPNQPRGSHFPTDSSIHNMDPYSVGHLRYNFSTNLELRGGPLPPNPSASPRFVGTIDNRACVQPTSNRSFTQLEPMVTTVNQSRPFQNISGTVSMSSGNMGFPIRTDLPLYNPDPTVRCQSAGFSNIPGEFPATNLDNRPSSTFFESSIGAYGSSPRPQCIDALDMDEQERLKLERKRAKNRVAAARCQTRKLERIARLEDKVVRLRDQNSKLGETVTSLSQHIARLKEQIIAHANYGCRLMLPQS